MKMRPKADPTPAVSVPAAAESRLGLVLSGGSAFTYRDVVVPGVGPAKIRMLSRAEEAEVDLAMARWMRVLQRDDDITETVLSSIGGMPLSSERATRIVAVAVRDPDDVSRPFGTLDEWRQLSDVQIGAAYDAYEDLVEELDPLGRGLSSVEVEGIRDAVAKKNTTLLLAYGSRRLALYLSSTVEPQPS
jgi:hypothetical protein